MQNRNNKINVWQFAVLMTFLGNGLFEGVSAIFLFYNAKQSAPFTALVATILGLIPMFLIYKLINYEPDKNLIEKIETLFSKKIASIINLIVAIIVVFILTFNLWLIVNFSYVKYLSQTPPTFLAILFLIPAIYTVYKGIEGIVRSGEVLFFIVLIFHFIITQSLSKNIDVANVLPLFEVGIPTIIISAIQFMSYTITPFLLVLIIPKNKIIDNHKLKGYYIGGYLFSMMTMVLVSFMVMSIIGPNLATMYRFPLYYVMKKIQIIGVIENVENIFATHWVFNMYITICMSIYYLHTYSVAKLKPKSDKMKTALIFLIAIIPILLNENFFYSSFNGLKFLEHIFPLLAGLGSLLIFILLVYLIHRKKKRKRYT